MTSQSEKGLVFRGLHHQEQAFVIPNPWDQGTARLLELGGFRALATTSAGYAFSCGVRDNEVARGAMIQHVKDIVSATDLPVSVDLGNGFADDPATVAETILLVAEAGAVGASIEDATGDPDHPIYDFGLSVERVRAAAAVARALPFPFTLTARNENSLVGRPNLDDTIRRLRAFQDVGADVLYAPGVQAAADIRTLVRSVDRPVNVVAGLQGPILSLADLSALGVKRVSLGSALARTAFGAVLRAAQEMRERGTFSFVEDAVSFRDISAMLAAYDAGDAAPAPPPSLPFPVLARESDFIPKSSRSIGTVQEIKS